MSEVGRAGSAPSPDDKEIYRHEFLQGLDLFKRALDQYEKTDLQPKKDRFKEVMNEALNVLNQTASVVCRGKAAMHKEEVLAKDYKSFAKDDSPENFQKLQADIQKLRDSV